MDHLPEINHKKYLNTQNRCLKELKYPTILKLAITNPKKIPNCRQKPLNNSKKYFLNRI